MKVRQLMSRTVHSARPEDSAHRAAGAMWEHDCGVIPVVDADDRLVGVVTDRDLCMAAWSRDRRLTEISVDDVMSRDLVQCSPEDSVEFAFARMRKQRVRRLPVVAAEGKLVGVLSMNDLARAVDAEHNGTQRRLLANEFVHAMAGVCEPRCSADAQPEAVPLAAAPR